MKKEKKKRSGFKKLLRIVGILLVVFFVWVWLDDEEYEDEDKQAETVTQTTSQSVEETAKTEEQAAFTFDDAIREKRVQLKGDGTDTVTILMYMNGSDLETESGEATEDLTEMVKGMHDGNVKLIVQTMNTKKWDKKYGISSQRTERYEVTSSGLKRVDSGLSDLSCTVSSTLENYIKWGAATYPADRYILLFWDHGGGPVYGFGYDDKTESEDMLSIDEMQTALKNAGVYFDFVGMDCCLMSCMELCCAIYDYCDYCILSEDFESGYGWYYTDWLSELCTNSSMPTEELGKRIIDGMVDYNRDDEQDAILALVDESYMKVLFASWIDFAYANDDSLFDTNYSRKTQRRAGGRVHPVLLPEKGLFSDFFDAFGEEDDYVMADYYVTDIMAVAENIESKESEALAASVNKALCYVNSCNGSANLTGISVTLPYGDADFYNDLTTIFGNCGFDESYINWLENFVGSSGYDSFYDYDDWDDSWEGWDDYEDDYDWDEWGLFFGSDWDDEYYDDDSYYYDDWFDDDFDWGWSDDEWWYDYGYGYDDYGYGYDDWGYGDY